MKVAVFGYGQWGRNLVRVFHQLGALGAICDERPEAVAEAQKRYQGLHITTDAEALFRDPTVEAAVIATPAETHFRLASGALEAGKDVFVEKPLALRTVEAETLGRLARSRKRVLMVGHLLRYHPAVVRLKELCTAGELGRLEYAYSNRLNLGRVRREENALWSFAPHDVSVLLHLFDSLPLQVSAVGGTYLQPNIPDVSVSNLLFDRGARAHIFVSWLHPFKEQKLVVVGERKMAVFDDLNSQAKLMLFDKNIEMVNGNFLARRPEGVAVEIEPTEPLRRECDHFLECLRTRHTPQTDAQEGLRVLRVLEACQRSLTLNGEPVALSGIREESVHA
jgi:predicted dehydrogenase